jgi:hypothetical protein
MAWLVLILVLFILSLTLLGACYFGRQAKPLPTPRPQHTDPTRPVKDHVWVHDGTAWKLVYAPDDYKTRTNILGNY